MFRIENSEEKNEVYQGYSQGSEKIFNLKQPKLNEINDFDDSSNLVYIKLFI